MTLIVVVLLWGENRTHWLNLKSIVQIVQKGKNIIDWAKVTHIKHGSVLN